MIIGFCDGCSKKRRITKVGSYKFDGKTYYIKLCQWCRAAATRRKNEIKDKPFWIRKGDK